MLADPPFSRLDMVSCRNVLIYLRPDAQARVLEVFHFALRDGGILLLGSAENALAPKGRFDLAAKAERIYRRVGRNSAGGQEARSRLAPRFDLARPGEERRTRAPVMPLAPVRPAALAELGRRLVMEAYAPASVLVDAANAVLFCLGPTDRYLRLPPGHATQDLLAMARPGLRAKLHSALQVARESKEKVLEAGWFAGDSASQPFSLAVHPVVEGGQDLLLVCFLDAPSPERSVGMPLSRADTPDVAELRRDLDATRTELQGTVRDLELSGEEQRAINEEALSVNEEYQSTNEGAGRLQGGAAIAERGADGGEQPATGNAGAAAHNIGRPAERAIQHQCGHPVPRPGRPHPVLHPRHPRAVRYHPRRRWPQAR